MATYVVPNALVSRYQARGLTIGECTMPPTLPMCAPPPLSRAYFVPRNTITLRENLGWTRGECGGGGT